MAFTNTEVRAVLAWPPAAAFGVESLEKRAARVQHVASVDEQPMDRHELLYYASTARVLDEVLTKARQSAPASASGSSSQADQTARAIAKWAEVQNAKAEKEAKRGTVSFNLEDRVVEVGLPGLQKLSPELLPTEESLLRMEHLASAMAAKDKGRKWVGPSEGEDMIVNFAQEHTGLLGFAKFLGHLHDWGLEMASSKVITPVQFWAYEPNLVRQSEEQGGGRVVLYDDMFLRQKLARVLELGQNDQIEALLCKLDRDMLQDAKFQVSRRAEEACRATAKQPAAAGGKAGAPKGDKHGVKGGGAKTAPAPASPVQRRSRSLAAGKKPKGKGAGGKQHEQ
ncbi:unnamed protein product, partial [Prorocentrum cordatum]